MGDRICWGLAIPRSSQLLRGAALVGRASRVACAHHRPRGLRSRIGRGCWWSAFQGPCGPNALSIMRSRESGRSGLLRLVWFYAPSGAVAARNVQLGCVKGGIPRDALSWLRSCS